jgi:ADP-ribose pyrophosphatase YjhB (NUDIX family)
MHGSFGGFGAATPPSAGGFASLSDPVEEHFRRFRTNNPITLGNGDIARPIWQIERANNGKFSHEEEARAHLLNVWWNPKGTSSQFAQRCPRITVDNLCIFFNREMHMKGIEPHAILGVWDKKDQVLYGKKQHVRVITVPGGGHYETQGDKNSYVAKLEEGDMSMRAAADKELKEEIGIDRKNSRMYTQQLGYIDDVFNDPRFHCLRSIYLRWVEQAPKTSEEIKSVIPLPVSQLHILYKRQHPWVLPSGEELTLGIGHDTMLERIMIHPDTSDFLAAIATMYDAPAVQMQKVQEMRRRPPSMGTVF